jgi:hypothetical protein
MSNFMAKIRAWKELTREFAATWRAIGQVAFHPSFNARRQVGPISPTGAARRGR